jgi:hypothetical protein
MTSRPRLAAVILTMSSFGCSGATTTSADGGSLDSGGGGQGSDAGNAGDAGLGDAAAGCVAVSTGAYDQTCATDSDCVAVPNGNICPGKCACDFGTISATSSSAYQAAFPKIVTEACPCTPLRPVCQHAQCTIGQLASSDAAADAEGTDGSSTGCGGTTCAGGQVCVREQVQGGAVIVPDDAGMCPGGRVLTGNYCEQAPSYHCAATPPSCSSGLACACAQSLCSSPYQCTQASAGMVQCVESVP